MRNIREILRQKWSLNRSHREVAASLNISIGGVSKIVGKADEAALTWDVVLTLTDDELERVVYGTQKAPSATRATLDFPYLHAERKRPGVTLALLHVEVPREVPRRVPLHAVLRAVPGVARPTGPDDAAGPPRGRQGLRRLLGCEAAHRRSQHRRGHPRRAVRRRARCVELHLRGGHDDAAQRRLHRQPPAHARVLRRRAGGLGPGPAQVGCRALVLVRPEDPADLRGDGGALRHDRDAGPPRQAP